MPPSNRRRAESGGALIYVFIGLALFAGLMLIFSKSSTNPGATSNSAQDRIRAQAVIEYSMQISQAIDKMIASGVSRNDLSFENTVMKNLGGTLFSPAAKYPNCTSEECKVFSPQGGRAVARRPLSDPVADPVLGAQSYYTLPGMMAPHIFTIVDLGTAAPELVITFHGFSKATCAQINTLLGNKFLTNPPVGDNTQTADDFIGAYSGNAGVLGDADDLWGKGVSAQCHEFRTVPGFYIYQKVVLIN